MCTKRPQTSPLTRQKGYAKNDAVYLSGERAKGIYLVKHGQVGIYQVAENGRESLLRVYGPGSYFGYRTLFTGQSYPATARAMLDSQVIQLSVKDYEGLYAYSPGLGLQLMQEVCSELGQAETRILRFNTFSAKKRILDALCYLFEHHANYPWTYREIAEFSGTDTSTVIRYCKTLKQQAILSEQSRKPIPTHLCKLQEFQKTLLAAS